MEIFKLFLLYISYELHAFFGSISVYSVHILLPTLNSIRVGKDVVEIKKIGHPNLDLNFT